MPNGGSDCCGTCWFNRTNRGERDWSRHSDDSVPPYCEIKEVAIDDPFYTYCANHPHRRPDRDPIPIGPITRYAGDGWSDGREVWVPSPDSEEIRQHLLCLLEDFFEHLFRDRYPLGQGVSEVIIWQLGQFRERRAERYLQWISDNCPDRWAEPARTALAQIGGGG